jgi:hypothetical protein
MHQSLLSTNFVSRTYILRALQELLHTMPGFSVFTPCVNTIFAPIFCHTPISIEHNVFCHAQILCAQCNDYTTQCHGLVCSHYAPILSMDQYYVTHKYLLRTNFVACTDTLHTPPIIYSATPKLNVHTLCTIILCATLNV